MEIVAWISAAIWVYLLAFRSGFWRMREARPEGKLPSPAPRIVAVIPARDEAPVVGRAITSLAKQLYPGEFQIVVVDDDSTDGTGDAARAAAPESLLTVIRARPLPKGWTGKLWAVSEGVVYSERFNPDFLLLTDADIVHPFENLAVLAARAESGKYDLVSYMATLQCRTLPERLLIPAFVFFFFMLYPPAWGRGAAGGCMLVRRTALEGIGGIAAIAGELIDDCALAAAVRKKGGRVWLGLNAGTGSIREYASFGEIGRMISRSAFTQLRHSLLLLIGTVLGLTVTYLVPPALALTGNRVALAAWVMMAIAYIPALRYYKLSPLWAPLLPLVALFYLGATIHSAVQYWRGAGGRWKSRTAFAREPRS